MIDLGRRRGEITNDELLKMSKDFGIAGITLFARQSDDIVGIKSTEPNDIGFSFKTVLGADDSGFIGLSDLLDKTPTQHDESYVDHNTMILLTSQSGSHEDKPTFFKYAYYHKEGQDFVVNPYIEANEVYQFTQSVGPNSWIKKVIETNKAAKEVAVLDPRVYADPSLAQEMYPPLKKVVYGEYKFSDKKDENLLKDMVKHPRKVSYITTIGKQKVYKMFIPMKNGQVIYVALNYDMMSEPLQKVINLVNCF